MKEKIAPKNTEFKHRCKEVFQVTKQTMIVAKDYFYPEEESYLDRLIILNNQNNFKDGLEEINSIIGEILFRLNAEECKSEEFISKLKTQKDKTAHPELHTAIIRSLCFRAIIHATEYMLSKSRKANQENNQLSLTNAYILLREVEQVL